MILPHGLTVYELINAINDLVITQGRRPTVDEVIAEVLARLATRLKISSDPSMLPGSSKQMEHDYPVASPRGSTYHTSNSSRVGTALSARDSVKLTRQPSPAGTVLPERNSVTLPRLTSPVERNTVTSPRQPSHVATVTTLSERNPVTSPRQLASPHGLNSSLATPASPRLGHNEAPPIVYAGKYYVVVRGRRVGIFQTSFDQIKKLIDGVPNNYYKGFKTRQAAASFYYEQKSEGLVTVIRTSAQDDVSGPVELES